MLDINVYSIIINVINIIVLFLILKKLLIGPVMAIMKKREDEIAGRYQEADQTRAQALEMKTSFEQSVNSAQQDAEQIRSQVREEAQREQERILKEADQKAGQIIQRAKQTAAVEQEKAVREIETEIAGLAMTAVAKIISGNDDSNADDRIYEQFMTKAGESYETNGN